MIKLCVLVGIPQEPARPQVTNTSCTQATVHWRLPGVPAADNADYIHRYYIRYRSIGQSDWTYIR